MYLRGIRPVKPYHAYPSKGIFVSLGLRDVEDLQLETHIRDVYD
jgi:hypothetical protein